MKLKWLIRFSIILLALIGWSCEQQIPYEVLRKRISDLMENLVWVEALPVQCLGNPWQQEWIMEHGGDPARYPRDLEEEILRGFFQRRGADFYQYRTERLFDVVCLACSCPEGYAIFLLIDEIHLPIFQQYGFNISGANLELTTDRSSYGADEVVTFQLRNPSKYTFTANGMDGFGGDKLMVARGSDFTVQMLEGGLWRSVEPPLAIEGTRPFEIAPNSQFQGDWFNMNALSGTFRIHLRVRLKGDSTRFGHVVSNTFTVSDSLVSFDPQPNKGKNGPNG